MITLWLLNLALVLLKELCPLLFQKLFLLLLKLIHGAMIFTDNGFSPQQCYALSSGVAIIAIIKVAVISQHQSHYFYLFSVPDVLGTGELQLYSAASRK